MSGIRRIVKWSARYIPLFIAIIALSIFLQWLYSYLPLFVQYSFAVLGYGDIEKVELPMFNGIRLNGFITSYKKRIKIYR